MESRGVSAERQKGGEGERGEREAESVAGGERGGENK